MMSIKKYIYVCLVFLKGVTGSLSLRPARHGRLYIIENYSVVRVN